MSIDREYFNGPITFCCDDCGDTDTTRCQKFEGALAKVKSHGWVVRKRGDDFIHLCRMCKAN